jgi:hypothetical protein
MKTHKREGRKIPLMERIAKIIVAIPYELFSPPSEPAGIGKYDQSLQFLMTPAKRVPVSEKVWSDLSALKGAGQTYDTLLVSMIEQEKKRRFITDLDRIEEEGDFVELDSEI